MYLNVRDVIHSILHFFAMQVGELTDGMSDINELEEMLFHFSKLLHPNHYILVDIMHNLVSEHTRNEQMIFTCMGKYNHLLFIV